MIEIPSEQSKKEELFLIISFVKEYFANTNVVIREYECNGFPSIVISNKETKEFDIILSGHLDVVPADVSQYTVEETDEYICGRGAYDMKSGVAVMMSVLKHFTRDDISVALMLTTDEETGGFYGTKYLVEEIGYRARVVIIPDGGYKESQMALKEKGILQLKLSTTGISAHGSRPWQGDNAIESLMRSIAIVQTELDKEKTNDAQYWYTTGTLSTISGGNAKNSVPDSAFATFDIRYTETFSVEQFVSIVQNQVSVHKTKVEVLLCEPCVFVSSDDTYVRQYVHAATSCGVDIVFSHDYGASDARFFAAKYIPVILSQPSGEGMHGSDEKVFKESLRLYKDILMVFIRDVKME